MKLHEVCKLVTDTKSAHDVRPRKGVPGEYDARPWQGGRNRGWVLLDSFSASAIYAVWEKLSPDNQKRLDAMPLPAAASICFRLIK